MRVLVVGSGAREHALAWKFSKSKRITGLFAAPGNGGTAEIATNLPDVNPEDPDQVLKACRDNKINMVFIGPEVPLAAGVADILLSNDIAVIGPQKAAAQLESSKAFAKDFMKKYHIPTADYREFSDVKPFEDYLEGLSGRIVLKKSGLAAGKGVLESENKSELFNFGREILADDTLIAEEFLSGYEVSIFALTDGNSFLMLPPCADFKKAFNGDQGPNTGGMGSICPVPWFDSALFEKVRTEIVVPTFDGLKDSGLSYKGVLFVGLMITKDGPKVLEYNVRLGDPETQVLLPIISSDFGNLCEAVVQGSLDTFPLRISDSSALGVVIASAGYPGPYEKGKAVEPLPAFPEKDVLVFHASTGKREDGTVVTGGGRCFTVVGRGHDFLSANVRAYEAATSVRFDGAWYRTDIGHKFFME